MRRWQRLAFQAGLRPTACSIETNHPSSDEGETVLGSGSDGDFTGWASNRRSKFAQKRRGRREVKRKGLDTTTMPCSWPNDVGPNLSFPPENVLSDGEVTAGGETEGEHVTDDDEWVAFSDNVVAAQIE